MKVWKFKHAGKFFNEPNFRFYPEGDTFDIFTSQRIVKAYELMFFHFSQKKNVVKQRMFKEFFYKQKLNDFNRYKACCTALVNY